MKSLPDDCRCRIGITASSNGWRGWTCFASIAPNCNCRPSPTTTSKHIIGQLCHGAVSYKDIKEREVKPVVMSWLSEAQRELLDKHAPERLTLPNGRTPKVIYEATGSPFISLRIQELYDVNQTPKIALGRVPVTGSHSDAGHEADPGDAGPGQFLARALSENQIRVAAEISETFLAMNIPGPLNKRMTKSS